MSQTICGKVYVVGDNIDTDQIIPAEHMSLVPTIAAEYRRLGAWALSGLPQRGYPQRLIEGQEPPSAYCMVIAGRNFGCGSSREHATIALGAAGVQAVVAESFARIFYRNCIATGEVYPLECAERLCEVFKTGDEAVVDLEAGVLRPADGSAEHALKPTGEVRAVISAGGLFAYARRSGLLKGSPS